MANPWESYEQMTRTVWQNIDWIGGNYRAVLVDGTYVPDRDADQFLSDIAVGDRILTTPLFTTSIISGLSGNAVTGPKIDNFALDFTTGNDFAILVFYRDTGVDATSELLAWWEPFPDPIPSAAKLKLNFTFPDNVNLATHGFNPSALEMKFFQASAEDLWNGDINWVTDTIKVVGTDVNFHQTSPTSEHFLSDVPSGNRLATGTLTNKAITPTGVAYFTADDVTLLITGTGTIEHMVFYKDTGTESTSPLLFHMDRDLFLPTGYVITDEEGVALKFDPGTGRICVIGPELR